VGLVTSSIAYEADIVIREVLKDMADTIEKSPLSSKRKQLILHAYEDYHRVYDAFVTATDSSEIRLKPHRDLYSIALHRTGISPADFDKVIGFEDSQSGTVAIRAAGIGCCIAVPFAQTTTHNLAAATHILPGGIPEAIIDHGLFVRDENG
jgi:beta-phosphoglucomutase-like phosphatase (HAD superfamily)